MYPSRTRAAAIARDTLDVLAAGRYANRAGATVFLRDQIEAAVRGTVAYPPDEHPRGSRRATGRPCTRS